MSEILDDFKLQAEILATLSVGASMQDAADYVQIDVKTIRNYRDSHPQFSRSLKQAAAKGKIHCINKIQKAAAWQAAAWMLEHKWWKEYGKKQQLMGPDGGPIKVEHTIDPELLTDDEVKRLDEMYDAIEARRKASAASVASSN